MGKENITVRAFRMYSAYNRRYFPLKLLSTVFDRVSPYFNLWMSAEVVNALYAAADKREIYKLVLVTLFGNLLIRLLGAVLHRVVELELQRLNDNQNAAFNEKTMSLDYCKLEDPQIRHMRRKITENGWINGYGVSQMRRTAEEIMMTAVELAFCAVLFGEMFVLMAAEPFKISVLLLVIGLVASIGFCAFFMFTFAKKISVYWNEVGDMMLRENRISSGYSISGMDSRIYKQQDLYDKQQYKRNEDHKRVFAKAYRKQFLLDLPNYLFSRGAELFSYLIICAFCGFGVFPVGSVIKYVGHLNRFCSGIGRIFGIASNIKSNEKFLKQYVDYFDIPNDMYQGSLAVEKRSDKQFDVEFKNVSFRYHGADKYALKNVSIKLKVGERLAVVGMNGSGKTTFIKLLCRLYDPTDGEILMNDFNVQKYDYRQYLDLFSVVFQDYSLMGVPLGNNIAGAATWDTEKAERLIAEVGLGARYAEMPKGLETPLYKNFDKDGVNISGGEAQKIALVRALYRNAPFIILDEPTAALDPIAEAEIYSKFDSIVGDKTAIYISHRLSSCRFCDKIAVFHEGEIIQVGTHEELLSDESGKYYEMWNAQAGYYKE